MRTKMGLRFYDLSPPWGFGAMWPYLGVQNRTLMACRKEGVLTPKEHGRNAFPGHISTAPAHSRTGTPCMDEVSCRIFGTGVRGVDSPRSNGR